MSDQWAGCRCGRGPPPPCAIGSRCGRTEPISASFSIHSARDDIAGLRHACAIRALEAIGDIRQFALWLGRASRQTAEMHPRLDPFEKLRILSKQQPLEISGGASRACRTNSWPCLRESRDDPCRNLFRAWIHASQPRQVPIKYDSYNAGFWWFEVFRSIGIEDWQHRLRLQCPRRGPRATCHAQHR